MTLTIRLLRYFSTSDKLLTDTLALGIMIILVNANNDDDNPVVVGWEAGEVLQLNIATRTQCSPNLVSMLSPFLSLPRTHSRTRTHTL